MPLSISVWSQILTNSSVISITWTHIGCNIHQRLFTLVNKQKLAGEVLESWLSPLQNKIREQKSLQRASEMEARQTDAAQLKMKTAHSKLLSFEPLQKEAQNVGRARMSLLVRASHHHPLTNGWKWPWMDHFWSDTEKIPTTWQSSPISSSAFSPQASEN